MKAVVSFQVSERDVSEVLNEPYPAKTVDLPHGTANRVFP